MPKQFVLNFQFELRQYRHRKNLYVIISKEREIRRPDPDVAVSKERKRPGFKIPTQRIPKLWMKIQPRN